LYIVDYVRFIIFAKIKTDAGIKKCLQESKKCCNFASRSARVRQLKRTELAWRVDTTTKNNKNNYLWKTISTMFRGNQLPAAAKEYKNQQHKRTAKPIVRT